VPRRVITGGQYPAQGNCGLYLGGVVWQACLFAFVIHPAQYDYAACRRGFAPELIGNGWLNTLSARIVSDEVKQLRATAGSVMSGIAARRVDLH
jgi:hypothetical protein